MEKTLPPIPAKRYFTIGEVSDLCGVKPYVLRYWEQEFTQLKPMKRRGNRRYYQHHEVLLIRRIRELLYEQGFTISGARNRLADAAMHRDPDLQAGSRRSAAPSEATAEVESSQVDDGEAAALGLPPFTLSAAQVRQELLSIRGLLAP
jgi:DNA-binding transcriptional MerR regulator